MVHHTEGRCECRGAWKGEVEVFKATPFTTATSSLLYSVLICFGE